MGDPPTSPDFPAIPNLQSVAWILINPLDPDEVRTMFTAHPISSDRFVDGGIRRQPPTGNPRQRHSSGRAPPASAPALRVAQGPTPLPRPAEGPRALSPISKGAGARRTVAFDLSMSTVLSRSQNTRTLFQGPEPATNGRRCIRRGI